VAAAVRYVSVRPGVLVLEIHGRAWTAKVGAVMPTVLSTFLALTLALPEAHEGSSSSKQVSRAALLAANSGGDRSNSPATVMQAPTQSATTTRRETFNHGFHLSLHSIQPPQGSRPSQTLSCQPLARFYCASLTETLSVLTALVEVSQGWTLLPPRGPGTSA
jgi:hypothetical protein